MSLMTRPSAAPTHFSLSLSQLTYNLFSLSLLYNITILFPPLEEEEEEMIENVLGISWYRWCTHCWHLFIHRWVVEDGAASCMFYWWFDYFTVNNLSNRRERKKRKEEKHLHSLPPASVQVNLFPLFPYSLPAEEKEKRTFAPPPITFAFLLAHSRVLLTLRLVCRNNHRKTHPPSPPSTP